jgi:death-on-curing protein
MISIRQVLEIHAIAFKNFGGSDGVRDMNGLESAIARPFQTFAGTDLYPTIFEKAAAIAESIIINHPFIDGNKRTGYLLMEALLRHAGFKITARDTNLYDFIINISTGSTPFDKIVEWLKENTSENLP